MADFLSFLEPTSLIQTLGLIGLFLIIFAESGLFFGFFLPGDSLLFTAGILASAGYFNIYTLLVGSFICAVFGDSVGYWFGNKIGPKIFTKEDSFFFHKKHIARAQHFYEKYGNKTIFLARFTPIIRTFAPIVAGIGNMKYTNFVTYNVVGGFVWSFSIITIGYLLGNRIPDIHLYIVPVAVIIIIISFIPLVSEYLKSKKI
jgi:membrane-associated protein